MNQKINKIKEITEAYAAAHAEEAENLLKELGRIPSPTGQEDARAKFCHDWLMAQGAEEVYIDDVKNVVCPIQCRPHHSLIVFAAHTDTVFPDLTPLPMTLEGRILKAPGISDDTANLVNLMIAAKYLLKNRPSLDTGILLVANTGEEGLGNLKGTRKIMADYGSRVKAFYSFDCYLPQCIRTAVGSYRYEITVKTNGGHSWSDFGSANAIQKLSALIQDLYHLELPAEIPTSYNVGHIQGGTTVNSIAQQASMLFEFRSISQNVLEQLNQRLNNLIKKHSEDCRITATLLGIRPGNGEINLKALQGLTDRSTEIIEEYCRQAPDYTPASTDSNIPLSLGIPANTIGTVRGGGFHTREEWVDLDSLPTGIKIILTLMLCHADLSTAESRFPG